MATTATVGSWEIKVTADAPPQQISNAAKSITFKLGARSTHFSSSPEGFKIATFLIN